MEEAEEPTKKRPLHLPTDNNGFFSKKPRPPELLSADESPDAGAAGEQGEMWSAVDDDESVEELMKLLEAPEVFTAVPFKVRFVPYPYSSPAIHESYSSSYITINVGNEESCGSSFSDLESSVMASIDLGSLNIAGWGAVESGEGGGAWGKDQEVAALGDDDGYCDWDWDDVDQALAMFIGKEEEEEEGI